MIIFSGFSIEKPTITSNQRPTPIFYENPQLNQKISKISSNTSNNLPLNNLNSTPSTYPLQKSQASSTSTSFINQSTMEKEKFTSPYYSQIPASKTTTETYQTPLNSNTNNPPIIEITSSNASLSTELVDRVYFYRTRIKKSANLYFVDY